MAAVGTQNVGKIVTLRAESAVTAHTVVTQGTNDKTCKTCGTTDEPIGVALNAAVADQDVEVAISGWVSIKADGAFAKGDLLAVADANGEVDTVAVLTGSEKVRIVGVAVEAAGAAGDLVEAQLEKITIDLSMGQFIVMLAGADLTSSQYCVVKQHSVAGDVVVAGTSDVPLGVLQNAPAEDAAAIVQIAGITSIKADADYSLADVLAVADANGEVDTAAGSTANVNTIGVALTAASGAGVEADGLLIQQRSVWFA